MMRVVVAVALSLVSVGCRSESAAKATGAAAPALAPANAAAVLASTTPRGPDVSSPHKVQLKTNYVGTGMTPHPQAIALCEALHTQPVVKKAECVGAADPGFMVTPVCVETLTAALAIGKVSVSDAAITACADAMKAATADCTFAKGFGTPLPAACDGLFTGSVARGGVCRSSMECEAGLQCFGVGPSDLGRCTPPAPVGSLCGSGVDALATYTRQTSVEQTRPACDGYCRLNRCHSFHAAGEACQADMQCGPGATCGAKTRTCTRA